MRNLLREKRIAAGYKSVKKFAEAININPGTYWNWENGYGATTYAARSALIAKKVCDALDITDAALKEAISNNYQTRLAGKMERAPRASGYAYKRHNKVTVLADWRMKEQIASRDVAEMLGVSQKTYLNWEDGTRKPTGDDLKNLMDLTGLSMHQIASMYTDEEPKSTYSYVEKPEAPKSTYSYGEKIGEIKLDENGYPYTEFEIDDNDIKPDPDEPEVIASPITPEEFAALNNKEVHENMDEVITERDENGKPIAGRYIFKDSDDHVKLTREGERKVAEYKRKAYMSCVKEFKIPEDIIKQEAFNEPHDFRDEVIDEVLEKMYGQMDYKKYVYLVGLLGR